jgi:glycosyltransferase involved in cell wall biosynthesis
MKVSVIIPTYNGAHRLMNLLHSLEQQQVKPDEVLIVVDGSTDNTISLLQESRLQLPGMRIIERSNGGRAKVRNTGATAAIGAVLLFVDDDMILPEDWVANHIAHHQQYPGSIMTGRLEDKDLDTLGDFLQFKNWLHRKWSAGIETPAAADSFVMSAPYITANNFSIPAAVFAQLGGFDERLTDAEDYDMAKRALQLSIPVWFSHKAFAWNNDRDNITCSKYIKRVRQYTAAQQRLQELKPEMYGADHQYASNPPAGIKGFIFRSLCRPFWIRSVDGGYWKWLPAAWRYKLYDMIVTANASFYPEKVSLT